MPAAVLLTPGGLLAGIAWLGAMSGLRAWRHRLPPAADALLAAGLCLNYLVHHLFATPARYRYISTASNFFAFSPALQLAVFAVAAGMAVVVTRLRERCLPA